MQTKPLNPHPLLKKPAALTIEGGRSRRHCNCRIPRVSALRFVLKAGTVKKNEIPGGFPRLELHSTVCLGLGQPRFSQNKAGRFVLRELLI